MQSIAESAAVTPGERTPRARNAEILLFLVCNGAAAGINLASRVLLSLILPYPLAIVMAYLIGMFAAFALSRTIVFRASAGRVGRQMLWFTIVNVAAVVQTLAVSLLFARVVFPRLEMSWHPETAAHVIGVAVPAVSSYFGHKHLSFGKPG
jgi:putative flippase GtrA